MSPVRRTHPNVPRRTCQYVSSIVSVYFQIRVVRAFQAGLERKDPSLSGPSAARLMEISRQLRQQEREGWSHVFSITRAYVLGYRTV